MHKPTIGLHRKVKTLLLLAIASLMTSAGTACESCTEAGQVCYDDADCCSEACGPYNDDYGLCY